MNTHRSGSKRPESDLEADAPETADVVEEGLRDDREPAAVADDPVGDVTAEAAVPIESFQRTLDTERDKYLRLAAEFENFRRRNTRERQEAGWRAQAELVQGLLDGLDDIMRFAHVDPATVDAETVVHGVALVEKKMFKSLGGHGLELLNPVGRPFDPAFHEAVGTEPAASEEEDHLVAKVYQPGYVFRGQLLRPARVVVRQWLS